MSNSAAKNASIGKMAWQAFLNHTNDVLIVILVQTVVRALAFAPVLISTLTDGALSAWMAWTITGVLYIALVMPLRCWGGEKFRRMIYTRHMPDRSGSPYGKWLAAEALRYAHGLLWGLPFLFCVGYYFYAKSTMSFTDMWKPVMNLAVLVGQEPDMAYGWPIAAVLVVLFALLFAYGWWRNVMLEYLPLRSVEVSRCFRWARRMRRHHRGEIVKNTAVNALLTLPALLAVVGVLVPYILNSVDFSAGAEIALQLLIRVLRNGLPADQLLALGAVALILYLPLCTFRKLRIAALAAKLMKGTSSASHHHGHAAAGDARPSADEHAAG